MNSAACILGNLKSRGHEILVHGPVAAVSDRRPAIGDLRYNQGFAAVTEIDPHLAASLSRRFRLIRQLGAGGMGQVFLAEQIAVGNRPVALKVLNRKLLDDPDFLLRFCVAASLPRHMAG